MYRVTLVLSIGGNLGLRLSVVYLSLGRISASLSKPRSLLSTTLSTSKPVLYSVVGRGLSLVSVGLDAVAFLFRALAIV